MEFPSQHFWDTFNHSSELGGTTCTPLHQGCFAFLQFYIPFLLPSNLIACQLLNRKSWTEASSWKSIQTPSLTYLTYNKHYGTLNFRWLRKLTFWFTPSTLAFIRWKPNPIFPHAWCKHFEQHRFPLWSTPDTGVMVLKEVVPVFAALVICSSWRQCSILVSPAPFEDSILLFFEMNFESMEKWATRWLVLMSRYSTKLPSIFKLTFLIDVISISFICPFVEKKENGALLQNF